MSLNPIPLKLLKTQDPVCKVGNEREYSVLKGAQEIFYYPFPTSGNANSSVNTINCNPTSQRTIIDRKLYIRANFGLLFTGTIGATGGTASLLLSGYDAPRAYPLAMVTKQISVQLGDQSVGTNLNQYFSAIQRYSFDMDLQNHEFSETPAMSDQFCTYGLNTNSFSSTGAEANFQSANSELNYYNANPAQVPRGFQSGSTGSVWYNISQQQFAQGTVGATAYVNLQVTEPVFLSPLYFGKGEHSGIIGIQNMLVTLQFDNLFRLWSHSSSSPNTIDPRTGVAVAVNSLYVLVKQLTPDALAKIPDYIPYPYYQITAQPTGNAISIAQGASATLVSGSITLNSIPTRLFIYAREQDSDLTMNSTDTFAVLENVTVQLGTRQLLSSATQEDLYDISRRNGCMLSWTQWSYRTGGPLALDLSKDIGLQPTESPGLLTRSSLIVTARFKNTHNRAINFILYTLICEEGTVVIQNGHMSKSIGVLTQADILAAENAPDVPYKQDRNIYGGAWYNDLWEGIKSGAKFVKDEVIPVVKDVRGIVKDVTGYGMVGGGEIGSGVVGGNMMEAMVEGGRKKRGRGLVGGKMISRMDM